MDLAREHLKNNRHREAAQEFSEAGELAKAAKIYETIFDYKNAIQHYVKAGRIQTAGDLLIRIGERKKAARLFEKAKMFDLAIQHYKETESYQELMMTAGGFLSKASVSSRVRYSPLATYGLICRSGSKGRDRR